MVYSLVFALWCFFFFISFSTQFYFLSIYPVSPVTKMTFLCVSYFAMFFNIAYFSVITFSSNIIVK